MCVDSIGNFGADQGHILDHAEEKRVHSQNSYQIEAHLPDEQQQEHCEEKHEKKPRIWGKEIGTGTNSDEGPVEKTACFSSLRRQGAVQQSSGGA